MKKYFYPIYGKEQPDLREVGGKGLSLIKMASAGLPVPPGFILTVEFFSPWLEQLRSHSEWVDFYNSPPDEFSKRCAALKALCPELEMTGKQKKILKSGLKGLPGSGEGMLFAVRSSSPEEDLASASFAGGYETVLGVTVASLDEAIHTTFASCLDKRVFIYKKEHGFPLDDPRIAVIIQQQVPSEVAGVGFSLNPVTNSYDEAVFNANWGLGESVVSGLASPDQYTVDKVNRKILDKKLGKKETSIFLMPQGGTIEKSDRRRSQFTLLDKQVRELTDTINKIEKYYGKPMDIEWAFAAGKLYLLQARPITAYIPLPKEMLTSPGKPRYLYLDVTLTIQGIHEPLSVMGTSWLELMFADATKEALGVRLCGDSSDDILLATGGRLYLNISNMLLLEKKETMANTFRRMDTLAAEIIRGIDEKKYLPKIVPKKLKGVKLKLLRHVPDSIGRVFEAAVLPGQLNSSLHRQIKRFVAELKAESEEDLTVREFARETLRKTVHLIIHWLVPTVIVSQIADAKMQALFKDESKKTKDLVGYLDRSLPGNVTVEMGLALYHLSQLLKPDELDSPESLLKRIKKRSLPPEFLQAWDEFMEKYGFRGPRELDIASPRYCDEPHLLLQQMISVSGIGDSDQDPQSIYDRSQMERHEAFEKLSQLMHKKGWLKTREFHRLYRIIEGFGGYRETHKYYVIMINYLLRQRLLSIADRLVKEGRLNNREQVFDVTLDDLDKALKDRSIDLRELAKNRTDFISRIKQVRHFPRVIDSRGTILRPPVKHSKKGEIIGQAISPGVVRGPVKVLNCPDEKPLLPGDIMVACATDPGWTPLFINAAAIVLEVGGMLQHGALVAREYGKPCVVGVMNATSIFKDGQMVEVDGAAGIIRLLDGKSRQSANNARS